MTVEIIGITQPLLRGMNANDFVAYCARVSNPTNQHNTETGDKLVNYLKKNNHWSPLEMVHVVIDIETTRDISRQILRHRSFSFQEFSQRYAVSSSFVLREARMQDEVNRQNSIPCADYTLQVAFAEAQEELIERSTKIYKWALAKGIAKEQARAVLPEGLTETNLYMSGSLRSWVHYVELRSGPETQLEHREIAQACGKALKEHFPTLF